MHQFRRTTALLATALALSMAGCATMDLAPETVADEPQLSDIEVKIPGTWWDSKRVKLDELAARRKQKLEQESQLTTPYSTAATRDLAKSKSPIVPPGPPAPLSGENLTFRNVLAEGKPLPDLVPAGDAFAAAPAPPLVEAPSPPPMEPILPAVREAPVSNPVRRIPEGERAPPLPAMSDRSPKPLTPASAPATAPTPSPRSTVAAAAPQSKPLLRGVVRGARGGFIAMLEIPGSGTHMAREGDTLMFPGENGQMQTFQVKRIANQQVLLHSDTNQAMVIQ